MASACRTETLEDPARQYLSLCVPSFSSLDKSDWLLGVHSHISTSVMGDRDGLSLYDLLPPGRRAEITHNLPSLYPSCGPNMRGVASVP